MDLRVKKLHADAVVPSRAHPGDAGLDLYTIEKAHLGPGERWGVGTGTRVGIYAPNSYHWLVYDLALIAVRAISVPFTDDFAGKVDDALLARYDISLLLVSKTHAGLFSPKPAHVAFIDADNDAVSVVARPRP